MIGIEGEKPDDGAGRNAGNGRLSPVAGACRPPDQRRADVEEEDTDHRRRNAEDRITRSHQRDGEGEGEVAGSPPEHSRSLPVLQPGKYQKHAADGGNEASRDHQGRKI
jgi:hypothetical protein